MFFSKRVCNPHNSHRVEARSIRDELPEMRMVSALELILNEDLAACDGIFVEDVGTEWAHILLLRLELQFNSDGIAKEAKIIRLRKP